MSLLPFAGGAAGALLSLTFSVATRTAQDLAHFSSGLHSPRRDWHAVTSGAHRKPCTKRGATCSAPQKATAPPSPTPQTLHNMCILFQDVGQGLCQDMADSAGTHSDCNRRCLCTARCHVGSRAGMPLSGWCSLHTSVSGTTEGAESYQAWVHPLEAAGPHSTGTATCLARSCAPPPRSCCSAPPARPPSHPARR